MGRRYTVDSLIPAAMQTPPPGSEATGTQQAPARRQSRSLPGFGALKRRVAACLPFCGAPHGAEAPEPTQMRPRAMLPPQNAGALPPRQTTEPRLTRQPLAEDQWMFGASASRPSEPPSLPLPLPGEAPAPLEFRRPPHHMLWPNERQSAGTVRYTPEGPVFEVASRRQDGVLAQRGRGKPAKPRDAAPSPLPVMPLMDDRTGRTFIPRLPTVLANRDLDAAGNLKIGRAVHVMRGWERDRLVPVRLEILEPHHLEHMVLVAGSEPENGSLGVGPRHFVALDPLFGRSLDAVASQCQDPQAVRNVSHALLAEESAVCLRVDSGPGASGRWGAVQASFDTSAVGSRLASLEPGQHWHIRVQSQGEQEHNRHAMGMAIQRLPDGDFRISVLNSNGWEAAMGATQDNGPSGIQRVYRTVDMEHAVAAMKQLLNGPVPPASASGQQLWAESGTGRPLVEWLSQIGPPGSEHGVDADRDEAGRPVVTTYQKAGDCGIEALFAFMASALQPADYKLAKAACLNTLVQLADRLEPPGTAPEDSALQAARRRLQERITTSLSGHMVASAPQAQGR